MKISEGFLTLGEYQSYYRIVGEPGGAAPLLLLHGGPGSAHNSLRALDSLAETTGRQLVMYDQIGCGKSSRPDKPELWRAETWLDELEAVRSHLGLGRIHLLGHSWGGMLAITYLCDRQPKGILSAILSSTLPSAKMLKKEGGRLAGYLPKPMQEAIAEAELTGDYTSAAYADANEEFMTRYCYGTPERKDPPDVFGSQAYMTAWGPSEFQPTGSLKEWDYEDKLHMISCPTLVLSGIADECTPLLAKTIHDSISGSRWELFGESAHMTYLTETEKYCRILAEWLEGRE